MQGITAKVVKLLKGRRGWGPILDAFDGKHNDIVAELAQVWPNLGAVVQVLHAHRDDGPDPAAKVIDHAKDMARRGVPDPWLTFTVYRIYDAKGRLLYVGQTTSGSARIRQHLKAQPWADQVARVAYMDCSDKLAMDSVERHLIEHLAPLHNIQHNGKRPKPQVDMLARIRATRMHDAV